MSSEFLPLLRSAGSGTILIATHERPDGDAIASLSATASILKENGFHALAILPDPAPDGYAQFLPENVTSSADGMEASLFITVDCSSRKRLAAGNYPVEACAEVINIDHHPDNEKFGSLAILDPAASSASQIVYTLFRDNGFHISAVNATRLLLGVITDSGCFRFDNTTPEALRTAAELMALGADHHRIIQASYCSKPENLLRLEAELVTHHLKTAFGGRFAWMVLDRELLKRFGVEIRNTETLIEIPRNLAGVEFAATLRPENGGFKLSLRSKNPPYSAGRIARALNGGGHEMAAGGFIPASSVKEAEEILLKHVETELKRNEKQSQ